MATRLKDIGRFIAEIILVILLPLICIVVMAGMMIRGLKEYIRRDT